MGISGSQSHFYNLAKRNYTTNNTAKKIETTDSNKEPTPTKTPDVNLKDLDVTKLNDTVNSNVKSTFSAFG